MAGPKIPQEEPADSRPSDTQAGTTFTQASPGPWWRAAAIGASALTLALGTLILIRILVRPLALLFLAVVAAEALEPPVVWLERRLPRIGAVIVVYLILILVVGGIGVLALPPLIAQAQSVLTSAPERVHQLQALIARWNQITGGRLIDTLLSQVDSFAEEFASLPLMFVSSAVEIALVVVMSIYWLIVAPALREFVLSLLPVSHQKDADAVLHELGRNMGGYVRGLMIDAVILGATAYVGLLIIGIKYHLVLALVAGLGGLIPIVGSTLAGLVMIAVALTQSVTKAVLVLVFYIGLQFFESNILLPNIIHRQAYISPFLVVFALFAGGAVGGILGALVAIPLTGALRVLVLHIVAPAIRGWTGAAEPDNQSEGE